MNDPDGPDGADNSGSTSSDDAPDVSAATRLGLLYGDLFEPNTLMPEYGIRILVSMKSDGGVHIDWRLDGDHVPYRSHVAGILEYVKFDFLATQREIDRYNAQGETEG